MRTLLPWILLGAAALPLAAAGDEREVVAAVQRLFDAMAAHDEAALRSLLMPDGRIGTVRANGAVSLSTPAEFAARIGAAKEPLLERIWSPTVLVQDRMATVWAPYDFHRAGKLTHCGIDSITLFRTPDGWRVAGVSYTVVDVAQCTPSPLGPPR